MTPYAIICPECRNEYPDVLYCRNCDCLGKLVIAEKPESLWPRRLAWGVLVLLGVGALIFGWLK